uniref:Uncharacterized protein n=1 Tax=Ciona savignyi TaxID=51511 RepID=H2YGQ9_CIOSA
MATVVNPGTVVMNAPAQVQSPKLKQYQKIMFGLSVTETVLGALSILFGIVVVSLNGGSRYRSYSYSYYYSYSYTTGVGEGIWCGIWILIAGILGIAASRTKTKSCLIHCHMGFAITAAVFAASQVIASSILAIVYRSSAQVGVSIVIAIAGFVAFIICIVSASYCCSLYTALTGGSSCCGTGCCGDEVVLRQPVGQHVVYVQQPHNQMPYYPGVQQTQTIVQGPGGQQYVTTPYPVTSIPGQPAMVMQQGMVMQNPQTTAMPQAIPANPQPQAPAVYTNAAMQKEAESAAMQPPAYSH